MTKGREGPSDDLSLDERLTKDLIGFVGFKRLCASCFIIVAILLIWASLTDGAGLAVIYTVYNLAAVPLAPLIFFAGIILIFLALVGFVGCLIYGIGFMSKKSKDKSGCSREEGVR